MKALACTFVLVACALGASACASSHSANNQSSTDALQRESTSGSLSQPLRNFIHSMIKAGAAGGPVNAIDVYGPASRETLVAASSGDWTYVSPREQKERFYLVVLHGHFVCDDCSGPARRKPLHGTIETRIWSQAAGGTDFGFSSSLPPAMSRLHRLALITLT